MIKICEKGKKIFLVNSGKKTSPSTLTGLVLHLKPTPMLRREWFHPWLGLSQQ